MDAPEIVEIDCSTNEVVRRPATSDELAEQAERESESIARYAEPDNTPTPAEALLAELEALPPDQPVTAAQLAQALKSVQ